MIKFKANPPPTEGTWKIGETEVPVGADQGSFKSGSFLPGAVEGDHTVSLTFTMSEDLARKPYTLNVKNALGEQTYAFELASSKIPEPADSSKSSPTAVTDIDKGGATIVGIVIVVVVIIIIAGITIFARAKSILCFKAKSGEPLEEEKEAFDDPEKGKLAEEVKPTPEKKAIVEETTTTETKKPESEEKEEKKSNGAHTPV